MSCEWGFDCEECNERTDTVFNHGTDRLINLVENLDLIKQVNSSPYLRISWETGSENFDEFLAFAEKHRDHETFTMVNEYGEFAWFDGHSRKVSGAQKLPPQPLSRPDSAS